MLNTNQYERRIFYLSFKVSTLTGGVKAVLRGSYAASSARICSGPRNQPRSMSALPNAARFFLSQRSIFSFSDCPGKTSGYQRGEVRQNARQEKTPGSDEIFRLPLGVEMLLELPQSHEVVEMFSVTEDLRAQAVPERGKRPVLKARKRHHAEIEALIALFFSPEHQLREEEFHDPAAKCREPGA